MELGFAGYHARTASMPANLGPTFGAVAESGLLHFPAKEAWVTPPWVQIPPAPFFFLSSRMFMTTMPVEAGMHDSVTWHEDAIEYVKAKHAKQKYGENLPYTAHLRAVADVAVEYGLSEEIVQAAWLHDTLEDTDATLYDLQVRFGREVASLVYSVTDEKGKNRKERAEKTYPKIRMGGWEAITLKLADRIANVRHSTLSNRGLLKMYEKEYPTFKAALKSEFDLISVPLWVRYRLDAMWKELDKLLS